LAARVLRNLPPHSLLFLLNPHGSKQPPLLMRGAARPTATHDHLHVDARHPVRALPQQVLPERVSKRAALVIVRKCVRQCKVDDASGHLRQKRQQMVTRRVLKLRKGVVEARVVHLAWVLIATRRAEYRCGRCSSILGLRISCVGT
jgi:hypothetical protein